MPAPLMKMLLLNLLNKTIKLYPDNRSYRCRNLKRNLLLFTQIKDLEIPTILVTIWLTEWNTKELL
jgi:ferrous iron transport protein B